MFTVDIDQKAGIMIFGDGDILVSKCLITDDNKTKYPSISFSNISKQLPIGDVSKEDVGEIDTLLYFVFKKEESIDILIRGLEQCREYLKLHGKQMEKS